MYDVRIEEMKENRCFERIASKIANLPTYSPIAYRLI